MDLLVRDVVVDGRRCDLVVEAGRIRSLCGERQEPVESGTRVLDGSDCVAVPTLYNGHTHAAMTLFRGFGDDRPLQEWLEDLIWPTEEELTPEDVYWGTRLACREMILSGTGFFNDMYWEFEATARAVQDSGLRARVAGVFIDRFDGDTAREQRRLARENHERSRDFDPRVEYALGPHSIYTVSRASLEWINRYARDQDLPVHIHLAETETEVRECRANHGMTPVEYLDDLDFLHENVVVAHGIWVEPGDVERLADAGASVVYNPLSNLKLTAGDDFPWEQYRDRGVPVCLGTDGAASNNNLNLFEEVKVAALLQKNRLGDPRVPDAAQSVSAATDRAAEVFDRDGGEIREGAEADFCLIDRNHPSMTPLNDLDSSLAYAVSPDAVQTVVVNGEVLMEDGQLREEEPVPRRARERARALYERAGSV